MTETTRPSRGPSRRPWLIAAPVLVLIALAIAWSVAWIYAANRAEREIEAWIDREARLGRIWNCGERSLSGFPFRFELRCQQPSLETRGGDPVRITSVSAHAVAQIWAPNHIIAEFQPPAKVEDLATGRTYGATWKLLQMSGVGDLSGQPQRFSLQVHEPQVQEARAQEAVAAGRPGAAFAAHLFEFHVRRSPAQGGAGPDGLDYAAGLTGGTSALLTALGLTGPVDLTLQGTASAAADLRPMPVTQRLRAWAAAGGVAKLERFALTSPQVAVSAQGVVSLNPQGQLNGALDLGFSGLTELTRSLDQAGAIPPELSPIVGALAMVGRQTTVEGRKGVSFALGFKDGVLRLGPVPVGVIPPVF